MITLFSGVLSNGKVDLVEVQVAVYRRAFPQLVITGLPSAVVRESQERILTTFRELGIRLPRGRYVVHLRPATVQKKGTWLDLAIWWGLYISFQKESSALAHQKYVALGEIGLDGQIFGVRGSLQILDALWDCFSQGDPDTLFLFPADLKKMHYEWPLERKLFPVRSVSQVLTLARQNFSSTPPLQPPQKIVPQKAPTPQTVSADPFLLRLCALSLVGGHSALLFGSPGQGKTHVKNIFNVLQSAPQPEALQVLDLQFDAGALHKDQLVVFLPSDRRSTLLGWKQFSAGRIFLADELPLWEKSSRELLQEFTEIGETSGSLPAIIIATANPCPCGFFGEARCRCTDYERQRYSQKLSGPLLDRLCLQVRVSGTALQKFSASEIRQWQKKITAARQRQRQRSQDLHWPEWSKDYSWEDLSPQMPTSKLLQEKVRGWSVRRRLHWLQVAYSLHDLAGAAGEIPLEETFWEAAMLTQPTVVWK